MLISNDNMMQNHIEKKYMVKTFGCQMNQHDSEKLAGMLENMGYIETDKLNESNLIIYNTCCVRENAEQKMYGHLGILKNMKKKRPNLIAAVCGCMMQQPNIVDTIKSKYKHVDIIFGTHNLHRFPELVSDVLMTKKQVIEVYDTKGEIIEGVPILRKDGLKAWVTIMYGCNNFCTYCIVPYVRGRERSRKMEDIINEIEELAREGCKEVTLLGQNVNSYGKDLSSEHQIDIFAQLLCEISRIEGIERIRFMTSHPKDLSYKLIEVIKDCNKVCKSVHLPFQSGSSRILKLMNRQYTKEQYIALAEKIKRDIPGISITTDIIVGFPGETEQDFQETLELVQLVKFDAAYTFLYSKRKGTQAAEMENQVPEDIVKERFDRLVKIQTQINKQINDELVGSEQEVLVEGYSKNNKYVLAGRTSGNKIVNFAGSEEMIGKLVKVSIKNAYTWWLEGEII